MNVLNTRTGQEDPNMKPVAFGEALPPGTRLTRFSHDKSDRLFTVIKFWMGETLGRSIWKQVGIIENPNFRLEDVR